MSGVAAIVHFDGRPVDRDELCDLAGGPDPDASSTIAAWCDGPAGLAVAGPQSRGDSVLRIEHAHPLVAVWDGRLDNRLDLFAALERRADSTVTDGELLVAAFRRWGLDCLDRLVGDFAFLVYDTSARRLIAARDHLGIRPLHYAMDGATCCVASRTDRLRRRPGLGRVLDEHTIAAFFVGRLDGPMATFFGGITRVPAGHVLTVDHPGQSRLASYWKPEIRRTLAYASDSDYVDHLRELLGQAVESRLSSSRRTGLLLSGGLDSMAVLRTIDRIADEKPLLRERLVTVTATFEEVPDESRDVAARLDPGRFDASEVAGNPNWTFDPHASRAPAWDEPLEGMYVVTFDRLLACAAARGVGGLLTGYGGDMLLTGNYYYLFDLLRERRWSALSRELASYPRRQRAKLLLKYIVRPLVDGRPSRLWRYAVPGWIAAPFARRTDIHACARAEAPDPLPQGRLSDRAELGAVDITQHAARMLWQQSEALRRGIELRHPFLDRRLFEFLLAVPAAQKIQRGRSKALLRLAVPDAVPRRPSAADGRPPLSPRALRERERANWEACFARSRAADAGYIDADSLHKAFRRYLDGDISLKYPLARTFRLEAWLQRLLDADRTETARVPLTSAYH